MKHFKLNFLLTVLLLMGTTSSRAWNVGDTLHVDGIIYAVNGTQPLTLSAIGCNKANMVIPATVKRNDATFTVTETGGAYVIPNGVDCSVVTSVTLPETIERLSKFTIYNSSITTLHIPSKVSNFMTSNMFLDKLTSITVSADNPYFEAQNGVLYTKGKKTLVYCPRNTSTLTASNGTFTIPNGVEKIEAYSLYNVANLKTLSIPASVKSIERSITTFASSDVFTAFTVNSANTAFAASDGVLTTKDGKTLVAYPTAKNAGGSYTVPTTVTKIDTAAFFNARITSINLSNVQHISYFAFYTSRLTSLTIPKSMKVIECQSLNVSGALTSFTVAAGSTDFKILNNALYSYDGKTLVAYPRSSAATSYTIAAGTEVIADGAFWATTNIKTLHIPTSVTSIGSNAFYSGAFTSITFDAGSKLKTINTSAFWRTNGLTAITLPASLEMMDERVFDQCSGLKTVAVAANSQLKTIGRDCFSYCPALESFTFQGSTTLETIGERAFANTKLKSFVLPSTVKYIGESAFNGCQQLTSFTFPADNASVLDTICGGAFANTAFTLTRLPSSVRCIGREAFWNCNSAASLAISSRTDSISPEAFKGCYQLKHINVDKANTTYSSLDGMLLTKDKETLVLFPPGKANKSFTLLAPSIKTIGDYAFYDNVNLTNVTIPNLVTSIGRRAFGLCENLNTITFLCDEMISPENIRQTINESSFDDGLTTTTSRFEDIDIHVRKGLLSTYEAEPFYGQFKSINPSFEIGTEEYIPVSQEAVDLLSTTSTDKTLVLPSKITRNRHDYAVELIGDYLLNGGSAAVREVVVPGGIAYIGAKAFMTDATANTSTVDRVFLIEGNLDAETFATTRFELDDTDNDYSEFARTTKVYVKKSVFNSDDFQNATKRYRTTLRKSDSSILRYATPNMFGYKITDDIKITNVKYGTFAREFDVDLSDFTTDPANNAANKRVYAFTAAKDGFKPGTGDGVEEGQYYVRMQSINADSDGDGTYIPAGTGVLLKTMGGESSTEDDFYYPIGVNDLNEPAQSDMVGVTRNDQVVTDTNNDIFVMQGGLFRQLKGATVTIPAHKAYLQIAGLPAGAKVLFAMPDGDVTAIDALTSDMLPAADGAVYDLQGRRVSSPAKGIYVVNGKKMVVK